MPDEVWERALRWILFLMLLAAIVARLTGRI
jgi:hypothetical protein